MSKLAHSNQETMDEIERRDRQDDPYQRGSKRCPRCDQLLAWDETPDGCRDPDCPVSK